MIPRAGTEYYLLIDKAYRSSQLLTHPIFSWRFRFFKNRVGRVGARQTGTIRMRGHLRMQAPAQSRLLFPRVCAAALLCLDPGLTFYVCAPELIAHMPVQRGGGKCIQLVLLFAMAIAISTSWPIRCQPQPCCPHSPHFRLPLTLRSD